MLLYQHVISLKLHAYESPNETTESLPIRVCIYMKLLQGLLSDKYVEYVFENLIFQSQNKTLSFNKNLLSGK